MIYRNRAGHYLVHGYITVFGWKIFPLHYHFWDCQLFALNISQQSELWKKIQKSVFQKPSMLQNDDVLTAISKCDKAAVSWKFGHCYFLHDFFDGLCCNYELQIILEKFVFSN